MLRKATRRAFIAIITLDGLIEAALHAHRLARVCVEMWVCVCECETTRLPYRCIQSDWALVCLLLLASSHFMSEAKTLSKSVGGGGALSEEMGKAV